MVYQNNIPLLFDWRKGGGCGGALSGILGSDNCSVNDGVRKLPVRVKTDVFGS